MYQDLPLQYQFKMNQLEKDVNKMSKDQLADLATQVRGLRLVKTQILKESKEKGRLVINEETLGRNLSDEFALVRDKQIYLKTEVEALRASLLLSVAEYFRLEVEVNYLIKNHVSGEIKENVLPGGSE